MSIFRRAPARACAAALLLALLSGCFFSGILREVGIGGDDPQWLEQKYEGVGAATVLQLAQSVVRERYPPYELDLYHGRLETGWVYGHYDQLTHQALRERVIIESESEADSVVVRLRVQQETSKTAGRTSERGDPGDWEPTDDDVGEAKTLLTKLNILMKDIVPAPPAPAPKTKKK